MKRNEKETKFKFKFMSSRCVVCHKLDISTIVIIVPEAGTSTCTNMNAVKVLVYLPK